MQATEEWPTIDPQWPTMVIGHTFFPQPAAGGLLAGTFMQPGNLLPNCAADADRRLRAASAQDARDLSLHADLQYLRTSRAFDHHREHQALSGTDAVAEVGDGVIVPAESSIGGS
jgi:hypothetical protein